MKISTSQSFIYDWCHCRCSQITIPDEEIYKLLDLQYNSSMDHPAHTITADFSQSSSIFYNNFIRFLYSVLYSTVFRNSYNTVVKSASLRVQDCVPASTSQRSQHLLTPVHGTICPRRPPMTHSFIWAYIYRLALMLKYFTHLNFSEKKFVSVTKMKYRCSMWSQKVRQMLTFWFILLIHKLHNY